MTKPIWQWSAVQTVQAIQAKEVSCEEVIQAHVDHMHTANPAINAVTIDLSDEALQQAKSADQMRQEGKVEGALLGVPITIKENADVKGQPTSNGLPALANSIAPDDSPVVRNLKNAGAIIIGRTNTPEFSLRLFTENPLRGLTKNPWNPNITCGGSSGGAGASIAAGIGCIAHGSDLGGSLRIPANCCGISTIKPTLGRVPAYNPSAAEERPMLINMMSTQGPLARSIPDLRLALSVMATGDPHDPWWVPVPLEGEKIDPLRVAVTTNGYGHPVHPAVKDAVTRAADLLANAGYIVEEREPPNVEELLQHWFDMICTEIKILMDTTLRQIGSEALLQVLKGYYKIAQIQDCEGYMRGLTERSKKLRQWNLFLQDYPLILTPTILEPPFQVNEDLKGDDAIERVFRASVYISSMNMLGLPAAVTPVLVDQGLPIGVQLIGRRYREDLCLDAAEIIQRDVGILVEQLWDQ